MKTISIIITIIATIIVLSIAAYGQAVDPCEKQKKQISTMLADLDKKDALIRTKDNQLAKADIQIATRDATIKNGDKLNAELSRVNEIYKKIIEDYSKIDITNKKKVRGFWRKVWKGITQTLKTITNPAALERLALLVILARQAADK